MAENETTTEKALADLRHDLRTPIGHVLGYGEMVWDELQALGQPALAEDVAKIQAAGKRLLALVDERLHPDSLGLAASTPSANTPSLAMSPPLSVAQMGSVFPDAGQRLTDSVEAGLLLIVDDNEDNRDVLARRLQKQGHWPVTASGGREALAALADQPFDLVLLDVMMPDMDGYEVLSLIKGDPRTQHVPVIMISALDEMDSVVRCIEMGAADYLPKPFNAILLRARIGAGLREKRARDRELRYTAEIAENYRQLKELERLRDDLTHMIVHDLRTPLTSVLSGLQTVPLVGNLNETQVEMLEIAADGGGTLLGMINDLLDVDKMEQNSLPLEITPLTAAALTDRALSQVALLARAGGLSLAAQVSFDLPPFPGDEDKLRRTLVNLLGNAIKFTPSGGTVTTAAELRGGAMLFSIRDTGEGIPPEAFARIFEKFGQVENRKAGRKMSTGLGLTFCKLAVEAHGGQIWVESQSGQGSVFYFTIPLRL